MIALLCLVFPIHAATGEVKLTVPGSGTASPPTGVEPVGQTTAAANEVKPNAPGSGKFGDFNGDGQVNIDDLGHAFRQAGEVVGKGLSSVASGVEKRGERLLTNIGDRGQQVMEKVLTEAVKKPDPPTNEKLYMGIAIGLGASAILGVIYFSLKQ